MSVACDAGKVGAAGVLPLTHTKKQVCVYVCVCVCVCARVHALVNACVCVCVDLVDRLQSPPQLHSTIPKQFNIAFEMS